MAQEIPIEYVLSMRQQGLSTNQIVAALQRSGYTMDAISNAVNQADIKEGIAPQGFYAHPGMQQGGVPPGGYPGGAQPMAHGAAPSDEGTGAAEDIDERIQEIAEAIIDEKWNSLMEKVNTIVEWKEKTETRLTQLEQQTSDLKDSFNRLHEGVLGKISDYDKGIQGLGVEIKALEKVFQKILPGFIENVNELSRITSKIKKGPV